MLFKSIDDVEDWLRPLDYEAFWEEVAAYGLDLPRRADCDRQIAAGLVAGAVVLRVLKVMVRVELGSILELSRRAELAELTWH